MALTARMMLCLVSDTGTDTLQIICFLEFHCVYFSLVGFSRGICFFIKVSELIGGCCKALPVGTTHACSRWLMLLSTSVADPGCLSRIRFFSIPDHIKELKYFNPKIVSKLSEI